MKKNKYIKLLCFIIVGIIIGVSGILIYNNLKTNNNPTREEVVKTEISPLLYEVTKDGSSNKMYLFGSIHVANTNSIIFPKYILDAYNNSHYLACEFDTINYNNNQQQVTDDIMNLMYQDGTTIKDHLDKEIYENLVDLLKKKNMYSELYDVYKPFFFQSLLSMQSAIDADISTTQGIDDYFISMAKDDKKTILELESASFQLELTNSFSDKLYNLMFKELIDDYDEDVKELKKLYQAWCDGNKEELVKIIDDDMEIKKNYTKDEIKLIEDYNKRMNDDRNKAMLKKAIEYFNNDQDVFLMVGAAHIISNSGLVNSLKEEGFTVKQITK